ncbi:MAG TPA: hypothetical protein VMV06_01240 [Acidimicrobiales bacterium]|nr:hypothetical protein [Acidimicrobiales bacterium]
MFKWTRRLAVLAAVAAIVRRLLESSPRAGQPGGGPAPTAIGGDTWPPVPPKPDPSD